MPAAIAETDIGDCFWHENAAKQGTCRIDAMDTIAC